MAEALGQPLMPWQQYVADIGGEMVVSEETGNLVPAYKTVVVTLARQNGKTLLVLAWEHDRLLMWGKPQTVVYSMQDGKAARSKLIEEQLPMIEASPLGKGLKVVRKSNGEETLRYRNMSRLMLVSSAESSGHGTSAVGLGVIDEGWDSGSETRDGAIRPMMRTVEDAQILVPSTMGTADSWWWNQLVETGRSVATEGLDRDVCYIEWSAPEDAESDDWDAVEQANPALGHTITRRTLKADRLTMTEPTWRRTAMNISDSHKSNKPIPDSAWERVQAGDATPAGGLVLGIESEIDQGASTLVMADSQGRVEMIDHHSGTDWIPGRVKALADKTGCVVAAHKAGPLMLAIGEEVAKAGVQVQELDTPSMQKACGGFRVKVADGKVAVRPHAVLTDSVKDATRKWSSDAWIWSRKGSDAMSSPIIAASVAVEVAMSAPAPIDCPPPMVVAL